jgi:hypothetical protein
MAKKETTEKKTKTKSTTSTKSKAKKAETVDVEKVIESIEKIDTNIVVENETNVNEKMEEEMANISEIVNEINSIDASQKEFSEKLQASPENAEEIIKNEIAKVTELKKKTEEKINKTPARKDITSWWNGIGFSM